MNAVVLGFSILTVLSVFLLYYSKHKKHQLQQHTKEGFVGSEFVKTIIHNERQWNDVEISQKEGQITAKENDLAILLQNLEEIQRNIIRKEGELSQLRKDKKELDDAFVNLLENIETIKRTIASYRNNDDKPFIGSLNVFDLQAVLTKKDEMTEIVEFVKRNVDDQLIYYTGADISTADKIKHSRNGIIQELNNVKNVYDRLYEILKKNTSFTEVCSGDVLANPKYPQYVRDYITKEFDQTSICSADNVQLDNLERKFKTATDTNFELGKSICESKRGSCIYETSTFFPKSYERGPYSYIFHEDRWPQDNSCEAQNSNCFSFDTLGADACKGVEAPMWFIKSDDPGKYYTSNVGYVPHKLNDYEWVCEIDLEKDKQIHNKERAGEIASANCLQEGRGYGTSAYDCWMVTDGDINISHNPNGDKQSKQWTDDTNEDGTYGKCEVDTTCRHKIDTLAHVECLSEDYSSTGNFECWTIDTNNEAVFTNVNRNTYELGEWNSNDNDREPGSCVTRVISDCRTMQDVNAEVSCLSTDNWHCAMFNFRPHASNIGLVQVMDNGNQTNKYYIPLNYNLIDNENKGRGECVTTTSCLNPEELEIEASCHNSDDNYRCWTVNEDHSASLTMNDMYKIYNSNDSECVTNDACLSMENALSIAEDNCHASETDRCYSIDIDSIHEDGSVGFNLADDTDGYTDGRLTKFVQESEARSICEKRTCPSKQLLCQSLSVSCYLNNPGNHIKTNASGEHDMNTESMVYDESLDKCVIPETCRQIPYCSYKEVYTGSSTMFDVVDVGGVDCSAGDAYGVKHKWMLESSAQESINDPSDHLNDLSKWSFIGSDSTDNPLCIRDPDIPVTSIPPSLSGETDEFACECTENNYSSELHYFINDDFLDNNGSGFETVEGICGPDDCGERSYHQAKVRLISCYGEKYKDVTSNVGTHNCVNHDACRRKCLNTGEIDGEPVIIPPDQGIHIQCYAPITNEEIDKFSYDEIEGTCSLNNCSDTMYGSCPYQSIGDNDGWETTGEIVSGTNNKNDSFNHNSGDEEIFSLGTGLSRNGNTNTINYDTTTDGQAGCPDPRDSAVPDNRYTKKSVYKYTRKVTQENDGVCIQVPDKIQVKYTIEENDTPCPKDCVYYWETDGSGNPVYGDCSSTCRETDTSSVTKTQNYSTREGNLVGNSTCPTPTPAELNLHTENCEGVPLCCTQKDGTWGDYIYNGTNYGAAGDCPSCTDDGNPFTLTGTTTGKITCDPTTGVENTTQDERTKVCNPNTCGEEVPDSSSYSDCSESAGTSCILSGNSFTKPGTRKRSYKVYSSTGQTEQSDNPETCSINCTKPSPPNSLRFTAKTADSIMITWNAGSNGDATVNGYDILYNNTKHNLSLVTGNTYTLIGLRPSSHYQIKVQKITSPPFADLFSNQIEVVTDQRPCGLNDYSSSFTHNGGTYTNLANVPCESANCGNMSVTKVYSPNNCNGSRANETVTKNCGYCVSTTGSNKFFHILFHDTNDIINTSGISDWTGALKSQFRFLVSGDIASYQMHVGKTPNEIEALSEYHKEFVTFELAKCYQCTRDKVLQVILTRDGGRVKSNANGDLYLHGGGRKLAYHGNRVIISYNSVMYIEHELERVGGFGDNSHKSAIYFIKDVTNSTYAKVNRSNRNADQSALTWVSNKAVATQFVITNNGALLREGFKNKPKRDTGNSWKKMTQYIS